MMNFANAVRVAFGAGLLLGAAGQAASVHGQSGETRTVTERVVVTLPNGKRIVREVEKQVPVAAAPAAASASPAPASADPFAGGDASAGDGGNEGSGGAARSTAIDPRILTWLGLFQSGDMRADANGDGRLSPADYSMFLRSLSGSGQPEPEPEPEPEPQPEPQPQPPAAGPDDGGADAGNDQGDGSGSSDDEGSADNGSGVDVTTGWTELVPSSDSMVLYVAENGSDSNDGLSPNRPLRSVAEGVRRLRDGRPDWLMLRRGDTWSEPLSTRWEKSGRSSSEPMVITSYGEGPRPRLITGSSNGISAINDRRREHLAFVSLHFEPGVRYQRTGMNFVGANISDVLIEDCFISGYQQGLVIQGFRGRLSDFRVRRNVIVDNAGSSHSQGVYAEDTDGLLFEENIFDRNGWRADRGRESTATIFAHNLYIQRDNTDVTFKNNWTSRAAAEGYKSRAGGVVDGNVFWQNPIAVSYGNDGTNSLDRTVTGTINDNVVLETNDLTVNDPRGWGIRIENTRDVDVMRNIVANAISQSGFGIAVRSERDRGFSTNLDISDNIIDDHGDNIEIDRDLVVSVDVRDNISTASDYSRSLVQLRGTSSSGDLEIAGNRYDHGSDGEPFDDAGDWLSLNEWQAEFDPQGGALLTEYNNGSARMEDYARAAGFGSMEGMLAALREQQKGNWDSRLTMPEIRGYFEQSFGRR
ncbi:MAG: right-handed parallel beta-helix repeat-containing protein [Planctomycetota bacterium]